MAVLIWRRAEPSRIEWNGIGRNKRGKKFHAFTEGRNTRVYRFTVLVRSPAFVFIGVTRVFLRYGGQITRSRTSESPLSTFTLLISNRNRSSRGVYCIRETGSTSRPVSEEEDEKKEKGYQIYT